MNRIIVVRRSREFDQKLQIVSSQLPPVKGVPPSFWLASMLELELTYFDLVLAPNRFLSALTLPWLPVDAYGILPWPLAQTPHCGLGGALHERLIIGDSAGKARIVRSVVRATSTTSTISR